MRVGPRRRLRAKKSVISYCGAGEDLGSLDRKEIKTVNPKRNHPWIVIRRTDTEANVEILWPPDIKSQLIGKDFDARKIRRLWQRMKSLDGIIDSMDMTLSKLWVTVKDREAWHAAVHKITESVGCD